jgi:hypothetical protein
MLLPNICKTVGNEFHAHHPLSQIFIKNLTCHLLVNVLLIHHQLLGHLMVSGHHFKKFWKCLQSLSTLRLPTPSFTILMFLPESSQPLEDSHTRRPSCSFSVSSISCVSVDVFPSSTSSMLSAPWKHRKTKLTFVAARNDQIELVLYFH